MLLSTYAVAIFALLFAGASALTLIRTVRHFDPQETTQPETRVEPAVAA
jgi:hypothetical protein